MPVLILFLAAVTANPNSAEYGSAGKAFEACLKPVVYAALRARQPREAFRPVFAAACPAEAKRYADAALAFHSPDNTYRDRAAEEAARDVQRSRDHIFAIYEQYETSRTYE